MMNLTIIFNNEHRVRYWIVSLQRKLEKTDYGNKKDYPLLEGK